MVVGLAPLQVGVVANVPSAHLIHIV